MGAVVADEVRELVLNVDMKTRRRAEHGGLLALAHGVGHALVEDRVEHAMSERVDHDWLVIEERGMHLAAHDVE